MDRGAPRGIVLVRGGGAGWREVRAMLDGLPAVAVVGETAVAPLALYLVARHRPDLIVTAADIAGGDILTLARDWATASPATDVVVLADRYRPWVAACLGTMPAVTGYLLWRDHEVTDLGTALAALVGGNLVMISRSVRAAAAEASARTEQTLARLRAARALTGREARVLRAMIDGLTQREVAERENVPLRSVQRIVADLQERVGARTPFVLGMHAWRLLVEMGEAAGSG